MNFPVSDKDQDPIKGQWASGMPSLSQTTALLMKLTKPLTDENSTLFSGSV